ncbi:MAG: hypothetical protein K9L17_14375 [Clostridiales bacterium]|nr:hypothetical protein [Clostridiales bacterium]
MARFIKGTGDWGQKYKDLPNKLDVDFHWSQFGPRQKSYMECMDEVANLTINKLEEAQKKGYEYVLFMHGSSTSRQGQTTARSIVRNIMRSKGSTPYVIKSKSIQHETVFLAVIKPSK